MDVMLRLPFCHEMPALRKVIDVPLVTGRPRRSVLYAREYLGIPATDSRPIVYFGMRGIAEPPALERAAISFPDLILVYFGDFVPGLPENTRAVRFGSQLGFAD